MKLSINSAKESEEIILIYRDHLLPPSETFIKAQAEGLSSFKAYYVGSKRVKGLDIPNERTFVLNNGSIKERVEELLFKLTGFCNGFIKKLENLRPKLIHAHFGPDGLVALPIANQLKIPIIITFHGYDVTIKERFAKNFMHKKFLKERSLLIEQSTLFIAVSDYIKQKMINIGFPAEKIVKHYIGVDIDTFVPDYNVIRKPIVLFVGRLVEKKGLWYLINAMSRVQNRVKDIELVVIGDGPLRKDLELMAAKKLKKYRFLGVKNSTEIRYWMNQSKVFCVPSIVAENGDTEGFGIVFAEANAMGLPVVSFATGGIPEAVANKQTGLLAEEKNIDALSEYIEILFKDHQLWNIFSKNGRERVSELFNLKKQNKKLEEIYLDIINN
jgi:colanic acid/amylovoran biosynthesis glycosyltransferase